MPSPTLSPCRVAALTSVCGHVLECMGGEMLYALADAGGYKPSGDTTPAQQAARELFGERTNYLNHEVRPYANWYT